MPTQTADNADSLSDNPDAPPVSNGEFDPWRSGGVLHNLSRTLVAIEVPQGAHHLDLMFSHPEDPPPVRAARDAEFALLREWLAL